MTGFQIAGQTRIHTVRLSTVVLRHEIDKALAELRDFMKWYLPHITLNFVSCADSIIRFMDARSLNFIAMQCIVDRNDIRLILPDKFNYLLYKQDLTNGQNSANN